MTDALFDMPGAPPAPGGAPPLPPPGAVLDVVMLTGPNLRVQVTSAGAPDSPGSVWAVTCDEPPRHVLVKRVRDHPPVYLGMRKDQYDAVAARRRQAPVGDAP